MMPKAQCPRGLESHPVVLGRHRSSDSGKPISLISLIDTDRQWFKANAGLPGIRFYAGASITHGSGERVGTLCVIDRSPGKLTERQRQVLSRLAFVAFKVLEARTATMQAEQSMRVAAASQKDPRLVVDNAPAMMAYWNADLTCRFANPAHRDWLGLNPQAMIGKHTGEVPGRALYELNKPRIAGAPAGQRQSFERLIPSRLGVRHGLAEYVPDVVDGRVIGLLVQVDDANWPMRAKLIALSGATSAQRIAEPFSGSLMPSSAPPGNGCCCRLVIRWPDILPSRIRKAEPASDARPEPTNLAVL